MNRMENKNWSQKECLTYWRWFLPEHSILFILFILSKFLSLPVLRLNRSCLNVSSNLRLVLVHVNGDVGKAFRAGKLRLQFV
jgi:hypothetical protein